VATAPRKVQKQREALAVGSLRRVRDVTKALKPVIATMKQITAKTAD